MRSANKTSDPLETKLNSWIFYLRKMSKVNLKSLLKWEYWKQTIPKGIWEIMQSPLSLFMYYMNQEYWEEHKFKCGLKNLMMVWKCIWTVLAKGNLINASHNREVRSNHCTLFLDSLCLLKDSQKKRMLLEFRKALFDSSSMNKVWSFFP